MKGAKFITLTAASLIAGAAQAIVIDDFNNTAFISDTSSDGTPSASVGGPDGNTIIGNSRDLFVELTGFAPTGSATVDTNATPLSGDLSRQLFAYATGGFDAGYSATIWDGPGANPADDASGLQATGLGGIDFSNEDALRVELVNFDPGIENEFAFPPAGSTDTTVSFIFYTDADNWSIHTFTPPAFDSANPTAELLIPFAAFNPAGVDALILENGDSSPQLPQSGNGSGADFSNIGAIAMLIDSTTHAGADFQIDLLETVRFVPIPTTAWLIALLTGVAYFRRRRPASKAA